MILATIAALAFAGTGPIEAKLTWHEFGPNDKAAAALDSLVVGDIPERKADAEKRARNPRRILDTGIRRFLPVPSGYKPPAGFFEPRLFVVYQGRGRQRRSAGAPSTSPPCPSRTRHRRVSCQRAGASAFAVEA